MNQVTETNLKLTYSFRLDFSFDTNQWERTVQNIVSTNGFSLKLNMLDKGTTP